MHPSGSLQNTTRDAFTRFAAVQDGTENDLYHAPLCLGIPAKYFSFGAGLSFVHSWEFSPQPMP